MTAEDRMQLLRRVCAESSQAAVARRIGYSSAAICQILNGTYGAKNTDKILTKVEEIYGTTTVGCPGLGESIPLAKCAAYRKRPWASINHEWIRMYNACRACERNTKL